MWIASLRSQWQRGKGVVNSFCFLFLHWLFVVCGLLRRFTPRNDSTHKLVIARVAFATRGNLSYSKLVIARFRRNRGNLSYSRLSLWRPKTCGNLGILGSSLREPKVRGNLGMGHNYSIDEFFSFLFLYLLLVVNSFSFLWINKLLVVYGLLRFARNDKGEKGWWILFIFCFCIGFLWFVDCFVVLLLAMTVYTNLSLRELFATCGNLVYSRLSLRDFAEIVAISVILSSSLWRPKICSSLSMGHQGTQPTLSLREPKVRGNLGIWHNYSIDDFFLFCFYIYC